MKYTFTLLIAYILMVQYAISQTILPLPGDELCPGANITFTATVPGSAPAISSGTGAPVLISGVTIVSTTSSSTVFRFTGRFRDVNIVQGFHVSYTTESGANDNHDYNFKKIKSLFYGACKLVIPNQTTIVAPRCEITSFPVNFSNVQYKTEFETGCFGSIANYEYLLPAGWSLGSAVSNGITWLSAGNNVTVTSDLSTGIGSFIRVRPVNTACGSGLTPGIEVGIAISRPEPTLTITGGTDNLCSSPASYTLTGIPVGATVSWSITGSSSSASITGSTTSPTVTLTPGTTPGNITLRATVTHCSFTYTPFKNIRIGTYAAADYNITQYPSSVCLNQTVQFGFPWYYFTPSSSTTYNWQWGGGLVYVSGQGTNVITFRAPSTPPVSGTPWVIGRANNSCGSGPMSQSKNLVYQAGCWSAYRVSPNPGSDIIKVEMINAEGLQQAKSSGNIVAIELIDKMGTVKYKAQPAKGTSVLSIPVNNLPADIYTLRINDGTTWHSQTVSILH